MGHEKLIPIKKSWNENGTWKRKIGKKYIKELKSKTKKLLKLI